jgi:hypothetical protein
MQKTLYIITGPPGSGKTTYAAQFPELPVFDRDLGNKEAWHDCKTDAILCTSAPNAKTKAYWLSEAIHRGFEPKLIVMWVTKMEAYTRMSARSGDHRTKQNNLRDSVDRWYKLYSGHILEKRVTL